MSVVLFITRNFLLFDRIDWSDYLTQQGIAHKMEWDFWRNIMCLCVVAIAFWLVAYIQLRRIVKLK